MRILTIFVPCFRLDDKLFSFWVLQGESFPFALVKGVFRFETGVKVTEFRDLRANPRSVRVYFTVLGASHSLHSLKDRW